MLPIKSTAATYTERTIRKLSYITHENIFKFILKFCFLFEVSSPAIFPPMKISKIPLSPLFLSPPLDFEKFQFPLDFFEFKNPVSPPSQRGEAAMSPPFTKGGGAAMELEKQLLKKQLKWANKKQSNLYIYTPALIQP